ncbi:MAG: hypothetical protein AAGI68_17135, partial [Planctomycetota bacterium]
MMTRTHLVLLAITAACLATAVCLGGPIETKGGRFVVTDPVTGEPYSTHTLEQKAIETAAALSEELGGVEVSVTREPVSVRYTGPATPAPQPVTPPEPYPLPDPEPTTPPDVVTPPAASGAYDPADGWLPLVPSADSRVIHVSWSEGDDANDGLSPSHPIRTIGKGKSMLRSGRPDWLLFRAGDTWNDRFGSWNWSGRSANEPMVIGAYGSGARPKFNVDRAFIECFNRGQDPIKHVVF